ncbi:hypothetical protein MJO28_017263 [Puccinia striiformis f. sp. tritici]|nr:hypothetical protein MJO28_017263 [Puccinia striiformis f. sp. tritici]
MQLLLQRAYSFHFIFKKSNVLAVSSTLTTPRSPESKHADLHSQFHYINKSIQATEITLILPPS